ncbi:MAG: hypothetical protein FJ214_09960 [Ignavibacteria bacterium]|nr:hypothetical protein [Ignavibacteria bacterium]
MSSKVKNTIIILVIMVILGLAGGLFNYVLLKGKVDDREQKIKELRLYSLDTDVLTEQLIMLSAKVAQLDSILANRKYNIPFDLPQSDFFDFINNVSFSFSPHSYVNIEYEETETGTNFNIYHFLLNGVAEFEDLNRLVYAIEESKLLKKISRVELSNNIKVDADGIAHYLVTFRMRVAIYSSSDDRFYVKNFVENKLEPNPVYDIFYPLIRNEIPPNKEGLLDVQSASLLALIPDGAFLSDVNGNTYLLWEGDKVYLGYLTNINYQANEVNFVLNKGGVVENVTLKLDRKK